MSCDREIKKRAAYGIRLRVPTITMQTDFIYDCSQLFVQLNILHASLSTGKERDTESGLDNFEARMYAPAMGRFMSPDDGSGAYADPANPQSWDLYSYVQNNPLINTDPDGHACIHIDYFGHVSGFEPGDCDNSTAEKANSGYYIDGTVKTIYTTTGDLLGTITGYSGTSADGNLMTGAFASGLPYGPLVGPANQASESFIGNTAGGVVNAAGKFELDIAGFFFPITHFAVSTLAGMNSPTSKGAIAAGTTRKPGSLGQFGNNQIENKIARDIAKVEPRASRGQIRRVGPRTSRKVSST